MLAASGIGIIFLVDDKTLFIFFEAITIKLTNKLLAVQRTKLATVERIVIHARP